jgi:hypothetical protein
MNLCAEANLDQFVILKPGTSLSTISVLSPSDAA